MLGRHHHEDQLLHYGHALARAQAVNPFDRARDRLQAQRTPAELAASEPAYRALDADPATAQTLGAQAAPGAGGAPPGDARDDCPCTRCTARRVAEAARRVCELAARVQSRLDALEAQAPPPPAPHDADPDAQVRPAAALHRR